MIKKEVNFINEDIKINVEILKQIETSYHCHKSIELIYIINGVIEVDKIDHKYILGKGDLYIINSEDIHKLQTVKDSILLMVHINEELIQELHGGLYDEIFRCRYIKSISSDDYLCTQSYLDEKKEVVDTIRDYLLKIYIINNLYKEGKNAKVKIEELNNYKINNKFYYEKFISLILKEFGLIECFQRTAQLDDEMSDKNYKFMRYISENYDQKITLDKIANEFNLSKYYISHLLNYKGFGGLNKYLNMYRSYRGRNMLFSTDKSVGEISELLGFSTPGLFIKGFKENFKVTPSEYRKIFKIKKENRIYIELEEAFIKEILEEYIEDYIEFKKSLQFKDTIKIDIKLLDKVKESKVMPKINFNIKSESPVYDSWKLKDIDSLYSIDFSNCKMIRDIFQVNTDIEHRYEKLLMSIRENKSLEEYILIENLIGDNEIATSLYYYYSFLNMMKRNVIEYNRDYLVTRDEDGNYGILISIKKTQLGSLEIKLELAEGTYKILVHKLRDNLFSGIVPTNKKEMEVIKRMIMPQCSIKLINNNEFILSGEARDLYLIEINL